MQTDTGLLHSLMQKEYTELQVVDSCFSYSVLQDEQGWFDSAVGVTYGHQLIRTSGPGVFIVCSLLKWPDFFLDNERMGQGA